MLTPKKLIFIDFDDTLFNTAAFKKEFILVFTKFGVSRKQFDETYYCDYNEKIKKYRPGKQIDLLVKRHQINGRELKKAVDNFIKKEARRFLFPTALKFLENLKKDKNNHLILLSYCNTGFQHKKIYYTGIGKYFEEIIVTNFTKEKAISRYIKLPKFSQIFLVEDHPDQIDIVQEKFPEVFCFRFKRKESRYNYLNTKHYVTEVKTLPEVLDKIKGASVNCFKINLKRPNKDIIQKAIGILKRGGAIVYPTETVYGLGGDFTNEAVRDKIYKIKYRPHFKPLPVIAADFKMAKKYVVFNSSARELAQEYWPGPLTLVLEARNKKFGESLAVRVPANAVAKKISMDLGKPLIATSANLAGQKNCRTIREAVLQLGKKVDLYLDGGALPKSDPSTIIDASDGKIKILRQGSIKFER